LQINLFILLLLLLPISLLAQNKTLADLFVDHYQTSNQQGLTEMLQNLKYRLQLLLREVEIDDQKKEIRFIRSDYRADHEYFYPASAIKTFASIAALLKLHEINIQQPKTKKFSIQSPIGLCKNKCMTEDSSNLDSGESQGKITIWHEIKKMQLISSNEAFNHLFNISNHDFLHQKLNPVFPSLRINHRLNTFETQKECLKTPKIEIYQGKNKYTIPEHQSDLLFTPYQYTNTDFSMGVGYYDPKQKKKIDGAYSFAEKNGVTFEDFQKLSIGIYFFEYWKKKYQFIDAKITDIEFKALFELLNPIQNHLDDLKKIMSLDPLQSNNPVYKDPAFTENRFKPMIQGILSVIQKDQRINLNYFNKAGKAMGSHMDNAVIEYHTSKKKKILLVTVGAFVGVHAVINGNDYPYQKYSSPLFYQTGIAIGKYLKMIYP
jgi:hypothetical protein